MRRYIATLLIILPAICLLYCAEIAEATNIDFNSNNPYGTIQDSDNYDMITLHDSAIVNMIGGSAEYVWSYDSSEFQMQNGEVSFAISVHNTSDVIITGGSINDLELFDSGIASISGGNISGHLGIWGTAIANIYGTNFNFNYNINGWLIEGNWIDNSPFTIFYRGGSPSLPPGTPGSPIVLHTIPEPATAIFLSIGMIIIRKRLFK